MGRVPQTFSLSREVLRRLRRAYMEEQRIHLLMNKKAPSFSKFVEKIIVLGLRQYETQNIKENTK